MRRAFTLIELLVSFVILACLASLLMPAVMVAREAARSAQCRSNLHQIGVALEQLTDGRGRIPTIESPDLRDVLPIYCPSSWPEVGGPESPYVQFADGYTRDRFMEELGLPSVAIVVVIDYAPYHVGVKNALYLDWHVGAAPQ